ncbi:SET domain-containing protein [Mycena chlorophos]|uniref:SET domain-containing protein n=1 Tax=Mycena chlorophos TaxID=658473 RepID=A0A8H6S0V6_MYCCL|nr:SET domain-containing protein [Mycena chlorophos]
MSSATSPLARTPSVKATTSTSTSCKRISRSPSGSPPSRHAPAARVSPPSPPSSICAKLNADVRSNAVLDAPYFDLAGHVDSRVYSISNVRYRDGSNDHTAAVLDVGVQRLLPSPSTPPPSPTRSKNAPSPFLVQRTGYGARAMFASEPLRAGFTILVERPVMLAPYIIGTALYEETEAQIFHTLLAQLPPETQARVLTLSSCKSVEECDVLLGIIRTNALPVTLPVPTDVLHPELPTHRALFLDTSRCNHSCAPNARWHWDPATLSLSLIAVRPIGLGDEITISYLPGTHLLLPRQTRQSLLLSAYNFSCCCAACIRMDEAESDAARFELGRVTWNVPKFEEWIADRKQVFSDALLVEAHTRRVLLIESEGLESICDNSKPGSCSPSLGGAVPKTATALPLTQYTRHLDALAMAYGALGDARNFREWTWRARESRPLSDVGSAKVLQAWITDIASFPVWGWRRRL